LIWPWSSSTDSIATCNSRTVGCRRNFDLRWCIPSALYNSRRGVNNDLLISVSTGLVSALLTMARFFHWIRCLGVHFVLRQRSNPRATKRRCGSRRSFSGTPPSHLFWAQSRCLFILDQHTKRGNSYGHLMIGLRCDVKFQRLKPTKRLQYTLLIGVDQLSKPFVVMLCLQSAQCWLTIWVLMPVYCWRFWLVVVGDRT
jgi:hypothetical protein